MTFIMPGCCHHLIMNVPCANGAFGFPTQVEAVRRPLQFRPLFGGGGRLERRRAEKLESAPQEGIRFVTAVLFS